MKAVVILADIDKINKEDVLDSFVVGADRGALLAVLNGISLDISIGDFDSVNQEEFELIKKNSKKVIKLSPIKDKSDTSEAVDLCKGYSDILILGGIKGKRIEHFYSNLLTLYNNPNLRMKDDNSLIETKAKSFIPNTSYKYISLFSIDDESIITLKGMKYNLKAYTLKRNDPLGLSNEIIKDPQIEILKGRLLVIYSVSDYEDI